VIHPAPDEHWLVLRAESDSQRFRLRAPGSVRVGRSPGSEILLTDPAVSREHAVLEWMPDSVGGGSWRITDRGSSAGTTVNGVTLRAYQSLPLEAGDRVGIGPLSLDYVRRAPEEHSTVIGRIEPAGGEHIEPIGAVALEAGHLDAVVAAGAEIHAATDEHGIAVAATAAIAAASGFSDVAFVRVRDGAFEVVAAQGRAAGGVRLSRSVVARAQFGPVVVSDAVDAAAQHQTLAGMQLARVVCVAVELGDRNYGFLYLADGGAFRAPLEPVAALVRAVASVAALAFANLERLRTTTRLEAEHRAMFDGTMQALIASIDAKDPYTRGHSARVAEFAHLIAVAAGMSPADADRARLCGLVHDIGKIGVPESVLRKAGKLDDEEFRQIAQHPVTGHEILRGIPQMADVLPGVLHHHEKWAGGGYPHGIAGDEIPVLGRLIAVADALDAMTTSRTYRSARPMAAAVEEIARCSGTHFDPGFAKVVAELDRRSLQAIVGLHVFAPGSLPGLVDAAAGAGLPATAGILRGHAEVARRTA
jgi:GAF domain-containing protein